MDNFNLDYGETTPLCHLMAEYGSDKSRVKDPGYHNYSILYYNLFKDLTNKPIRLFELGVHYGFSLRAWAEFFPLGKIYGADIEPRFLFKEERIKTFWCDQTNPNSIKKMWGEEDLKEDFDIIIDDAIHNFVPNMCFFENSIHKLKPGGYFIIEDITSSNLVHFKDKINEWKFTHPHLEVKVIILPQLVKNDYNDNNIAVIRKNM